MAALGLSYSTQDFSSLISELVPPSLEAWNLNHGLPGQSSDYFFFLFLTGRTFGEVNLFLCKETEKLNDPPTHPQP